jgi:plastocyanin
MCVDLNEAFDYLGGLMGAFGRGNEIEVRFRLYSDSGWNQRGIKIDDLEIIGLDPDLNNGYLEDGPDTMDTMDNFCMSSLMYGQFWEEVAPAEWCAVWPDCGGIEDALVWTTEIMDAYEAYLTFETMFDFDGDAEGRVQISSDGGATWYTLALYTDGHTNDGMGWFTEHFDISAHAGNPILVRFIYENHGTFGYWCIKELQITGKKDTTAPTSDIQMTGTMKESGWYSTPVSITITAEDEGSGVKEIHYKLDGVETVVAGDTATFTVSGDGEHNIEFWAVDFTGNEGEHFTIPTFRIDSGSAPTVAITAPEPGLYLFGNKILSASKVIIIGAFTIEATASDAESGIYRVQFYLDGDIIAEDTEAPFSTYCAEKHMGAGTIKVVAEDFAQNTAEDTLDITYYKFL